MEITIIAKEACSRILGMKELQYKGMDIHELIGEGIKTRHTTTKGIDVRLHLSLLSNVTSRFKRQHH